MIDIKKWPIPAHAADLTDEDLAAYLFQKADDAGRNNMGMPDLLLAEAAHRLVRRKGSYTALIGDTMKEAAKKDRRWFR